MNASTSLDTDCRRRDKDGIELLSEIKAHHPEVSVVLITAYAGEYSAQDALEAGADAFIAKPFKNVEITHTLREMLVKSRRSTPKASPPAIQSK